MPAKALLEFYQARNFAFKRRLEAGHPHPGRRRTKNKNDVPVHAARLQTGKLYPSRRRKKNGNDVPVHAAQLQTGKLYPGRRGKNGNKQYPSSVTSCGPKLLLKHHA